jgi:SAM-dependent methyltransferase
MNNDEGSTDRMKNKSGFTSESTNDSTNKNLHDWNKLYAEMNVEDMHWYLPELDPDLKDALDEYKIGSGTFLDLGTGPGTQAIELKKMGFDVTGIDISENAINKARKLSDSVKFIQDDILNSHMNQQFDFIFDRGCFHIIDEDKRSNYLTQVVKLLNKNGMLFLKCFSDKNTSTGVGPHLISKTIIESLFQEQFNILQIKDSVYQSASSQQKKTLFVVLKKNDEY